MKTAALLAAPLALAAACSPASNTPGGPDPVARFDLRAAIGAPSVNPVGITVDTAGDRFVLDTELGIWRLDGNAPATRTVTRETMLQTPETVQLPFTDLTAVAPGQFAVTAISDGYLLDTTAGTIEQHFCYVPDGTPVWLWQRTDALAYDAQQDLIWAQPLTFDEENVLQGTDIASYDRATGELRSWESLPLGSLDAGAMVVLPRHGVVVAEGSLLYTYDPVVREVREIVDLANLGVTDIEGLARDPARASLLVLDGPNAELLELDLAALGLYWPG
jgi:hypothetical protein